MVNSVETSRGLIGNRRKDAEIKVDDLTVRLQSLKYKTELKFDELAERVLVCKQQFSEGFAQKSVTFLEEVQGLADQFDEKISYLDAVIEQIDKMRSVKWVFNLRMMKKRICLVSISLIKRRSPVSWLKITTRG